MLMFVPSESTYADLHEHFPDLLQRAHRARVVIVSPNMLMLAVQTIQAIMKDVRMREQADIIQREVRVLLTDVGRLRERVLEFQRHFGLLGADVEKIVTSTNKIASRGQKIEDLDFEQAGTGTVIAVNGGGGLVV
jgi:DNA recombination protein RmuC